MADQKITQLASLLGSDTTSGDLLSVVDISDNTMGASGTNKKMTLAQFQAAPFSAGTVNGVTYLNGFKVLTSGSALTFDGTNLGVNSGGAVEIGNKSVQFYNTGSGDAFIKAADDTSSVNVLGINKTDIKFYSSGSEGMRLNSTGLGIGTSSPGAALHIQRSSANAVFRLASAGGSGRDWDIKSQTDGYLTIGSDLLAGQLNLYQGNFIQSAPTTPPTLTTNGQMVFNLTSNTNLRVSVRGSDGVTRTANITLA